MTRVVLFDFETSLLDSNSDSLRFVDITKKLFHDLQQNGDHIIIYSSSKRKREIEVILAGSGIYPDQAEILGAVEMNELSPGQHGRIVNKAQLTMIDKDARSIIFVTADRKIDTKLKAVFCVLVPNQTQPIEMPVFSPTGKHFQAVLLSDELLNKLKILIDEVNKPELFAIDPHCLNTLYDKLFLLAYRDKRDACADDYYSIWARFFCGESYSRTAKLEAADKLITSLSLGIFNKSNVPNAAKNGTLSTLVGLIDDSPTF